MKFKQFIKIAQRLTINALKDGTIICEREQESARERERERTNSPPKLCSNKPLNTIFKAL